MKFSWVVDEVIHDNMQIRRSRCNCFKWNKINIKGMIPQKHFDEGLFIFFPTLLKKISRLWIGDETIKFTIAKQTILASPRSHFVSSSENRAGNKKTPTPDGKVFLAVAVKLAAHFL